MDNIILQAYRDGWNDQEDIYNNPAVAKNYTKAVLNRAYAMGRVRNIEERLPPTPEEEEQILHEIKDF